MSHVTFEMQDNTIRVRVDGKLLTQPRLNKTIIHNAVKKHLISPAMKTAMFKKIEQELRDNGLNAIQIKHVVARFEEEFEV